MQRPLTAPYLALMAVSLAAVAGGEPLRYVAFGDSITEAVGFDETCTCQCPEACGYPLRLQRWLEAAGVEAVVENHGLGGERTPEALSRLDEVLAGGGDGLLLLEGTNDISRGISLETTLFNLDQMAAKAEARGLSVVHATLLPRPPTATFDADNLRTEEISWRLRELAFLRQRRLTDVFEVFSRLPDAFSTHYSERPGDPVGHPNGAGFELLAGTFGDVLLGRDSVGPVLGFVSPRDGAAAVEPATEILLRLYDFGDGIDLAATRLTVNGEEVGFLVDGTLARINLSYQPPLPLSGAVTVELATRDLAEEPNASDRVVTAFTVRGPPFPALTHDEVVVHRSQIGGGRAALELTSFPGDPPRVLILTPAESGSLVLSTHVAQHGRTGLERAHVERRLAALLHPASLSRRDDLVSEPMVSLVVLRHASDIGAPGELAFELGNGRGGQLRASSLDAAEPVAATSAGNLLPAVASTADHKLNPRDRLILDALHELLTVKLCDRLDPGETTCYDAYVEATRRREVNQYELVVGCLEPASDCGEAVVRLRTFFDGNGELTVGVADFSHVDHRFTLSKELAVRFKPAVPTGELWDGAAELRLATAGAVDQVVVSFADLYAAADPSRRDPTPE